MFMSSKISTEYILNLLTTVLFFDALCAARPKAKSHGVNIFSGAFDYCTPGICSTRRRFYGHGEEVSYQELIDRISGKDIQLFDVREPDEFSEGRIPTATNIPLDDVTDAFNLTPEEFKAKYGVKKPGKTDDNVVFHCLAGYRSYHAVCSARAVGYNNIRHYAGGWEDWAKKRLTRR